jgi:DNA-directed RNA polymerase specialized sigma24 family protein
VTGIDATFERARAGSRAAFADWMGTVELPLRRALGHFARAVDVEAVIQEAFLRMWLFSQDRGRTLSGENASLRFAIGLARNLARAEGRRLGNERLLPPEDLPEQPVDPEPPSDPGLREAISDCVQRLAARPLQALRARIQTDGLLPDRQIAAEIGMKLNTFLQNIVRARRQVATCLERKGISIGEVLR